MDPNQNNQPAQPPMGAPEPQYQQQPVQQVQPVQTQVNPVQPPQQYQQQPVQAPAQAPPAASLPLGLIALGVGVVAVITLILIGAFATSFWLILIAVALGAAGLVVALLSLKSSTLTAAIVIALTLGTYVVATGTTQVIQGATVQIRIKAQTNKLKETLKSIPDMGSDSLFSR